MAQLSSCALVCVFPDTFPIFLSFLSQKKTTHLVLCVVMINKILFYTHQNKADQEVSFSARFCGVKQRNNRGTTTVNTQLLSQSHNENLIGTDSFGDLQFWSLTVYASCGPNNSYSHYTNTEGRETLTIQHTYDITNQQENQRIILIKIPTDCSVGILLGNISP